MQKYHRITGLLLAFSLFAPTLALAQVNVTGSSTIDLQVQSLLSQITALQQQLKSLIQSVAPSSTNMIWMNGTTTRPSWMASTTPGMLSSNGNCSVFSRDLSVGSEGDDVAQLQQMLQGAGFFSASSTGFFGPMTAHALQEYQMHFGIAATSSASGFFGPLTRRYVGVHCEDGNGNDNANGNGQEQGQGEQDHMTIGSSTVGFMMHLEGTSTMPGGEHGWMNGSTSAPIYPCPMNDGEQGGLGGLFQVHVILPGCGNHEGNGQSQGLIQGVHVSEDGSVTQGN
ncbi:MAG: peptidoglycan-binding domain-containing protein [Candidatus Pacebacteria bacterium]|nr:peptidoglycan-binding domain-containing protein [Candidatus Paceibacterota bacterium]